jgi:hypothetical protein
MPLHRYGSIGKVFELGIWDCDGKHGRFGRILGHQARAFIGIGIRSRDKGLCFRWLCRRLPRADIIHEINFRFHPLACHIPSLFPTIPLPHPTTIPPSLVAPCPRFFHVGLSLSMTFPPHPRSLKQKAQPGLPCLPFVQLDQALRPAPTLLDSFDTIERAELDVLYGRETTLRSTSHGCSSIALTPSNLSILSSRSRVSLLRSSNSRTRCCRRPGTLTSSANGQTCHPATGSFTEGGESVVPATHYSRQGHERIYRNSRRASSPES